MRPLIVCSDITVDGFMAGPDNDLDFMAGDPELENDLPGMLAPAIDTMIWGRASFAPSAAYWTAADGELADWMNATPKVVLSTDADLDVRAWQNSTLAAGDGVEQVRRLKESSGRALVVFGGVHTVRSLVAADLVDEYWLKINPVVVGRGGSMFSEVIGARALTLRSAQPYPSAPSSRPTRPGSRIGEGADDVSRPHRR